MRRAIEAGGELFGPVHRIQAMRAGNMHHIDIGLENLDLFRAFFRRDAAFHLVVAVHAQFYQQAVAHDPANFLDHHEREGAALFHGSAEFIAAVVGERGKEIVEQPAVRVVQAEPVEVGDLRPVGVFAEQGGDFFKLSFRGRRRSQVGFVIG